MSLKKQTNEISRLVEQNCFYLTPLGDLARHRGDLGHWLRRVAWGRLDEAGLRRVAWGRVKSDGETCHNQSQKMLILPLL